MRLAAAEVLGADSRVIFLLMNSLQFYADLLLICNRIRDISYTDVDKYITLQGMNAK
jgi:hypothetical protein